MEVAQVIDESGLRLPGKLYDFVLEECDAFAKELRPQVHSLNDFTGVETNLAQRRPPVESGAFIEKPIAESKTLSESVGVVQEGLHNLEGVLGPPRAGLVGRRSEERLGQYR